MWCKRNGKWMVNSMDKNLTVPAESSFTVDQEIYTAVRGYVVAA